MKNPTMLTSFICGVKGLFLALRGEKNFRFYLAHILLTLPVNLILHFSAVEHLIYLVCVVGVFATECVNTAVERICDSLTQTYNENIKAIKDISAGAVLCWGLAFYIAEAVMVGGKFFA
jgi:diacylglycerol kinase